MAPENAARDRRLARDDRNRATRRRPPARGDLAARPRRRRPRLRADRARALLAAPVRFVFPHAPVRPVTINGGVRMRAWYDILGFGAQRPRIRPAFARARPRSARLIDREVERGVAPERDRARRILSRRGGRAALRRCGTRGGSPACSLCRRTCRSPRRLPRERTAANAAVPIFMAHGSADPVIPLALAEASRRALERQGYAVDWHDYPMPHAVCAPEIAAIGEWLDGARRVDGLASALERRTRSGPRRSSARSRRTSARRTSDARRGRSATTVDERVP